MGPYVIEEVVSLNAVKLRLPSSMRIHLVVNVSQIVRYKEQVKRQKKEEGKLVEVECYDRCLLETAWTWVKGMMT